MPIPVYLFTGFLEAGKTTFLQETLEDPEFNTGEKTLLLLCEDGEVELATNQLPNDSTTILSVESEAALTTDFLKKQHAQRIIIEYNGMWNLQTLFDALPEDWQIAQMLCVADASTFASYLNNMRQLVIDKLQDPDAVIFNRCNDKTDRLQLHRAVRMVNRRAQIIFEYEDGTVSGDDIEEELPFDLDAPLITIKDEDYGIWYLDIMDKPKKYEKKKVQFLAYVCQTDRVDKKCFVAGRFGMTCCADDISFIGMGCTADNAPDLPHRSWVLVTATVEIRKHAIYEGYGPWLVAESVVPAEVPKDELVYFLR